LLYFRLERRNNAVLAPKLCDLEANSQIITEFEAFLRNVKFDTSSSGSDLSTIRKMKGHLFHYPDSLLQFQSDKIPNFSLKRYFSPNSEMFLEVKDPSVVNGWMSSVAGSSGKENPGRRKEMLKSHARFRDFVHEKLQNEDFGVGSDGLLRRELVIRNLVKISEKIKEKQLFSKLTKLETNLRTQKIKARDVINPTNNINEQRSVKQWFLSKQAHEEEKICMKIYEKCVSGSQIGSKDFNKFANWTRFTLVLEDRNRRSVYSFSNSEFASRRPKYLPDRVDGEDATEDEDPFHMLPDGWNPDIPQKPGQEPSCWVLDVAGNTKGLKGGKPAKIILTPRSCEILLKFRDIKSEVMKDVDDESQFFVNIKGKPLAPLQNTPGSLLEKFGIVCGVLNPTVNSFRRAAEVKVQGSPLMKSSVQNIQSHSRQVGLDHYDRSLDTTRANFIHQLAAMDSPLKAVEEVPEAVKLKRKKKEEEDRANNLKKAKGILMQDKMRKKDQGKVLPEDREFLQKLFSSKKVIKKGNFPDDQTWRRIFYRTVDSLEDGENGNRLRRLEEQLFIEFARPLVEEALGCWTGSAIQNKSADVNISNYVKISFKAYEKTRESIQQSYFKF
jgi:hypothetical protein